MGRRNCQRETASRLEARDLQLTGCNRPCRKVFHIHIAIVVQPSESRLDLVVDKGSQLGALEDGAQGLDRLGDIEANVGYRVVAQVKNGGYDDFSQDRRSRNLCKSLEETRTSETRQGHKWS